MNHPPARADLPAPAVQKRLAFWRSVCGCHAGALAFLAGLAWTLLEGAAHAHGTWLDAVLRGAAIVVGAGVLGKALAVLGARAMLAAEMAFLARRARRRNNRPGLRAT